MIQNNDEIIANYQEHALKLRSVSSPVLRLLLKEKIESFFRRLSNIQFIDAIIRKDTSAHYIPFPVYRVELAGCERREGSVFFLRELSCISVEYGEDPST